MLVMSVTTKTNPKRLSAYLNDQLADETFAVELVKRAMSENTGTPALRAFLEVLGWELEEDRDILVRLMGRLGVRRKHVGVIAARVAEKLGEAHPLLAVLPHAARRRPLTPLYRTKDQTGVITRR
jgi:hypothetical protein